MLKTTFKVTIFMALFILFTTSCKEDSSSPSSSEPPFPVPTDAEGVLVAIKTFSTVDAGPISMDVIFGTGVAVFPGGSGFLDAGEVALNDVELEKTSNNSYTYTNLGDLTNPTGIDLSGGASWDVEGNGDVPAMTNEEFNIFPSKPTITSSETINRADGYNFTWSSITNADSIIVSILTGSDEDNISVTVAGNTTSRNFTADELSKLRKSNVAILQIAAYKITSRNIGGSKIYFINQSVATKVPAKVN